MCIGAEEGCHEVPEPIAPIDMMFFSLEPTRIPISSPDITSNGPMFIEPIPGMPSMPFIPLIAPGEGLAPGIGMLIFCSGEPCGFGEADGICMPGIFICICGDAEGEAAGICIPGMLPMSCFFAVCLFFPAFLFFRGVAFDLGFGFALLIPGIFDMSCLGCCV